MRLVDRLFASKVEERISLSEALQQQVEAIMNGGLMTSWQKGPHERIGSGYAQLVSSAYHSNGPVFATILARLMLFSEARFQFRGRNNGRPGDLFGTPALEVLDHPWEGATTGDLLARMEQDASLAGNSYTWRPSRGDELVRWRPDWTTIVHAEVEVHGVKRKRLIGYLHHPGSDTPHDDSEIVPANEVAHYAPIPDPLSSWVGMSWLSPVIREIEADKGMTLHKRAFFEHAATPNLLIKVEKEMKPEALDRFAEQIRENHSGAGNAYKTMVLTHGADATVLGRDFQQMDFTDVQGAGENRIAAAGGVPGIVVGLKEGLEAATYSNYAQAMRRFNDLTMRPLWRNAAGSLARIIDVPDKSELWYDDRDIPALQADAKDDAAIQYQQVLSMKELIMAGYVPATVQKAVAANDMSLLAHTGSIPTTLYPEGKAPDSKPAA